MNFRFSTEVVTPVIGVLGGLFLLVRAIFPGARSYDSKQLRVALGFAGASAL